MDYRFYLDDLEIEEPTGWADIEISIKRDEKYHGIQFEASTGTLGFYGVAGEYLIDKKELEGIRSLVIFRVEVACDTGYEEVYSGRLNFGKYKKSCGRDCRVYIPVEEDSCKVIFKSRFDQKVDIDSLTAFDGLTVLPNYTNMGQEIVLPAKALDVRTEGFVSLESDSINLVNEESLSAYFYIRPIYERELFNSIDTGQVKDVTSNIGKNDTGPAFPISPQLLFEDNGICFSTDFEYDIRLKGNFSISGNNDFFGAKLRFLEYLPTEEDISLGNDSTVLSEYEIVNFPGGTEAFPQAYSYDQTFTGSFTAKEGYGYYAILQIALNPGDYDIENTFDPETYFLIQNTKLCPATNAKSYLIHETISRVTEAITNRCMRAKSEYYGRIDSEPFAFDSDGCGGLRMLTSGLKIRRAPEDKFFASPKDLLDGLYGIDNIGFGVEDDPVFTGKSVLRVEPVDYFYQDDEILSHPSIPKADSEVQESMHYSRILIGYRNWKVERVNGLDEPNSNREYRTSLETVNVPPNDLQSEIITGSYPIEITRQQSFAATGAADTRYDDNTFMICLARNAYNFEVEQGNITSPANMFDPDTIMNYRLSPVRNLMRWYKSLINSYVNLNSTDSKLFFSAGTGNLTAEGEITEGTYDQFCKLENMVIREDQNLFITHFERVADATPLWKPETITYEYPMSVADYRLIKAKPYGYISFQCGNGDFQKGFINEVKYRMARGVATFNLKIKW